jgi:hypothetical protein
MTVLAPERRRHSPAYLALRPSSRRLLMFIETEIARGGVGPVTIFNDQLEMIGSRRVYLPGLYELHALGLVEVTRYPKRHVCQLSDGWRDITTRKQAMMISGVARFQRRPPPPKPSQPASVSA